VTRPRVVVIGAGFGGLRVARGLRRAPVDVLLLDAANYHLFQPLLYQVATAGLAPTDIAYPVRGALRRITNAGFRLGTVTGADLDRKVVTTAEGTEVAFDFLVVAAGARTATFGVPGADEHARGLKTLEDALRLRSHLLLRFEEAAADPGLVGEGALTTVVVGGGPTGVELAGALRELHRVLAKDFPGLPVDQARVVLVELAPHVLAPFHERLRRHAVRQLEARGVELRLGRSVAKVTPGGVVLDDGSEVVAQTVVWAAGVQAAELAAQLGFERGPGGRIVVDERLAVPGRDDVWVIGDIAAARDEQGQLLPQVAPVAMQGGLHVAAEIASQVAGTPRNAPFRYRDKGTMATIGRRAAVAQLPPGLRFRGTLGWLMWLGLHLVMLIGYRNRASVLLNWAYNYLTWERGGRLITYQGEAQDEPPDGRGPGLPPSP
jgi:NADH:ubiquinone reductase (H+-translocating)